MQSVDIGTPTKLPLPFFCTALPPPASTSFFLYLLFTVTCTELNDMFYIDGEASESSPWCKFPLARSRGHVKLPNSYFELTFKQYSQVQVSIFAISNSKHFIKHKTEWKIEKPTSRKNRQTKSLSRICAQKSWQCQRSEAPPIANQTQNKKSFTKWKQQSQTMTETLTVSFDDRSSQRQHPPSTGYYPPVGTELPHSPKGFSWTQRSGELRWQRL